MLSCVPIDESLSLSLLLNAATSVTFTYVIHQYFNVRLFIYKDEYMELFVLHL